MKQSFSDAFSDAPFCVRSPLEFVARDVARHGCDVYCAKRKVEGSNVSEYSLLIDVSPAVPLMFQNIPVYDAILSSFLSSEQRMYCVLEVLLKQVMEDFQILGTIMRCPMREKGSVPEKIVPEEKCSIEGVVKGQYLVRVHFTSGMGNLLL